MWIDTAIEGRIRIEAEAMAQVYVGSFVALNVPERHALHAYMYSRSSMYSKNNHVSLYCQGAAIL